MSNKVSRELLQLSKQMQFLSDQIKQVSKRLEKRTDQDWAEWSKSWEEMAEDTAWFAKEIKSI